MAWNCGCTKGRDLFRLAQNSPAHCLVWAGVDHNLLSAGENFGYGGTSHREAAIGACNNTHFLCLLSLVVIIVIEFAGSSADITSNMAFGTAVAAGSCSIAGIFFGSLTHRAKNLALSQALWTLFHVDQPPH